MPRSLNALANAALSIFLGALSFQSIAVAENPPSIESRILSLEQRVKSLEDRAARSDGSSKPRAGLPNCNSQNIKPTIIPSEEYNAKLLSSTAEARGVPYFRDGKQVGLRLFAIRQNGIISEIGLQNGDVVLQLDGELVGEIEPLFSKLFIQREATTPATRLCVERSGREVAIAFKVE